MLDDAVRRTINEMNHRRGHALEGWEESGFSVSMVEVGGVRMRVEDAVRSLACGDPALGAALAERLAASAVRVRMSPAEAWASFGGRGLKRWDAFTATRILGPELAQRVSVTPNREFFAKDMFSGQKMAFGAVCGTEGGVNAFMEPGKEYDAWVNPFSPNGALVCETDGRFVGVAPYIRPTVHGDREHDANLAILGAFRGEQRRRAEAAAAGKAARETARYQSNTRAVATAREYSHEGTKVTNELANDFWTEEDEDIPAIIGEAH
jgi:hypothetical protein